MVRPAQFLGPLQGYQPTLPAPASRTLRVPPQPRALALASDLRSSLAVHFLDHGRLFAADGPSTSPYAANALLPMSVHILCRRTKSSSCLCRPCKPAVPWPLTRSKETLVRTFGASLAPRSPS